MTLPARITTLPLSYVSILGRLYHLACHQIRVASHYEDPVGIPHDITPEWTSPGFAGINDVNLWYHHEVTYDIVTKEFEWYVDGNHMFTHASSGAYGKVNGIVFSAHPHGDFKEIKLTAAPAKVELK